MNQDPNFDRLIAEGLEANRYDQTEKALEMVMQASALALRPHTLHFLAGSEYAKAGGIKW